MKENFSILMPIIFGVIAADYVGPQNGNGNGNSYGVPPDSITPPQPQGGPYPPSGWKPSGRRLLLPGESRSAQQPIDSGYGQPPPSQYGPVNPSPSGPSIDSQYGPSVDNTGPPNNQYIPGTGFGNGGNGGNGFSNGNSHNGNGGNGHGNGNGNGHNGGNGNGHNGGNGNGHNGGNGNGNGHTTNGNGHSGNGNGANGFSNGGNGNKFPNGSGQNGSNGASHGNGNGNKGSNGGNGSNGFAPAFHGAFPGGVIYPFVQHSVPAVLAFRPGNGAGHGSIYPIYQVPISPSTPTTGVTSSSFPAGHGVFSFLGANPSFQILPGNTNFGTIYPDFQISGTHDIVGSHQPVIDQGTGLIGHGTGSHYTLSSNHQPQNSHILGIKNGLSNLQLQYSLSNAAYGNGVPLGVF